MRISGLFTVLALAALAVPAGAVNKCKGADGKVEYQDAPCSGKGEHIDVRPASGHSDAQAQVSAQRQLQKLQADNAMADAIRTHQPLVGMTEAQLEEAMGKPAQVNASNYSGVRNDQWVYYRPGETWYVYTRNGIVESIQYRPGSSTASTVRVRSGPCPSQHEINNAITSATSISLSDVEKAERWRMVRAMQDCGK